jgi:5'-nucleotidase
VRLAATAVALAVGATPLLFAIGADAAAPSAVAPRLAPSEPKGPLKVDLLAINDFHGQLEVVPASSSGGRVPTAVDPDGSGPQSQPATPAGGAAYLGWHLGALRADAADRGAKTVTVAAGDLIGATPLLSAAFHDEPSIETMNKLGLDISSVGNHEFDQGWRELVRLHDGGCRPDGENGATGDDNPYKDSCPGGKSYGGADFDYLSANVIRKKTGETVFPEYTVKRIGTARNKPVKMAFIGMTLEDTPNIVTASGVKGLEFIDEVEAVERVLPELENKGIKAITVLLHEGGAPSNNYEFNGCPNVTGPGMDIAKSMPSAVDVVVSGHTHQGYNCIVSDPDGKSRLFTSAYATGRLVTDISLEIGRKTQDVKRPKFVESPEPGHYDRYFAKNHIVTNGDGTKPRAGILSLIAQYKELVADIENQILGQIAPADQPNNSVSRTADTDGSGDSPLGNLIADAQLADPSVVTNGQEPVIAFMNPGGIRADLVEDGLNVTYGKAFAVQPFNNYLVSVSLTGQQILDLLEEQWNETNDGARSRWKILQVAGITYTWDETLAAQPNTTAVTPGSVKVDENGDGQVEEALDPTKTYRIVTNNFLADGGDGFATFKDAENPYFGGLDIDAFAAYLEDHSPYEITETDRIELATASQ